MSLPRLYLETSFISYLASAFQQRHSRDVNTAHRQLASLRWWTQHRQECSTGHQDAVRHRLRVVAVAELLPDNQEIIQLTARLLEPGGPLPRKAEADASHIAFASAYECEYLLTWNFRHIANALLEPVLNRIIQSYGYRPPIICTPEQLLSGYRDH